jgi:uncharacterized protein YeaO (DUF488 family)
MTVYTSYFARAKNFSNEDFIKIAICFKPVRGFGIWFSVVPPAEEVFALKRGEITEDYFRLRYIQHLNERKDQIAENTHFLKNPDNKDVILLCYEKPQDFCHRHILADWLNENFELGITEHKF